MEKSLSPAEKRGVMSDHTQRQEQVILREIIINWPSGVTQRELRERTGVQNITARISGLRSKGYLIKVRGERHGLALFFYDGYQSCEQIRRDRRHVWTEPVGNLKLSMRVQAHEINFGEQAHEP